jgi:hypothetical protein
LQRCALDDILYLLDWLLDTSPWDKSSQIFCKSRSVQKEVTYKKVYVNLCPPV